MLCVGLEFVVCVVVVVVAVVVVDVVVVVIVVVVAVVVVIVIVVIFLLKAAGVCKMLRIFLSFMSIFFPPLRVAPSSKSDMVAQQKPMAASSPCLEHNVPSSAIQLGSLALKPMLKASFRRSSGISNPSELPAS